MSSCSDNTFEKPDGEPLFITAHKDNQDMSRAFSAARHSLPQFLKLSTAPQHSNSVAAVKIRLRDHEFSEEMGEDRFAYIWVSNVRRDEDEYLAYIFELPKEGLNELRQDQWIRFEESFIHDWMILTDSGHLWGGYTIRVLRRNQPEARREHFDEYQGITVYEPVMTEQGNGG